MKEKDFENNLSDLIIDGLIKEAGQDNADFENAMRMISNDDFFDILLEPVYNVVYENLWDPCTTHMEEDAHIQLCKGRNIDLSEKNFNSKLEFHEDANSFNLINNYDSSKLIDTSAPERLKRHLPDLQDKFYKYLSDRSLLEKCPQAIQQVGWELALTFVKLRKKIDAKKVLIELSSTFAGTDFEADCKTLLTQLD